jgi:uncharacterized membrane protein
VAGGKRTLREHLPGFGRTDHKAAGELECGDMTNRDAPTNRALDRTAGEREPSIVADENIRAVARIQDRAARRRTPAQRATDWVSSIASRESAIGFHVVLFSVWIAVNVRVLPIRPFDPFPFGLLTALVSLEAIFLTLFVLASQHRLTHDADRRAHLDLQINLLSEQEMTVVLQMLGEVCQHLGLRETINSPKFQELVKRTDVGQIADHLDRTINNEHRARPGSRR